MPEQPTLAELLPHRAPMLLIDRFCAASNDAVHCQLTVSPQHLYFDPISQAIPGWVGIELMAQTIATWSGYRAWQRGAPAPIGFLLGSRRYQAHQPHFALGSCLDIYADCDIEDAEMAVFSCRIDHAGVRLADARLNVFLPTPASLQALQQPSATGD